MPTTPPGKRPAAKKPAAKKAAAKPRTQAPTKRDRDVVARRHRGQTFETITKALRFRDVAAAHAAYERGLTKTLATTPTEERRAHLQRITEAEEPLWPKAERGHLASIAALVDLAIERTGLSTAPPPDESRRKVGPVETATRKETDRLEHVAPALAAAALVLARVVDDNATSEPGYVATASHQLRMHMSQLRGLAGTVAPDKPAPDQADDQKPTSGKKKSTVVPESKLEQLRREARERSSAT